MDTLGIQTEDDDDGISLTAFFLEPEDPRKTELAFRARTQDRGLNLRFHSVSLLESDPDHWLETYTQHFSAFTVGRTFHIHPGWTPPCSQYPVNILMEPGIGFGTGTHESTQLALLGLADPVRRACSFLDVGTGSGILTIAAKKLNPVLRITAFDNDALAVSAAAKNLERNGIFDVDLFVGEPGVLRRQFDLIVANLTLGLFRDLAADILRLAGGELVLSGFTEPQTPLVWESLEREKTIQLVKELSREEWAGLHLRIC
jgi:ribosomal protein L11 methyltransferase